MHANVNQLFLNYIVFDNLFTQRSYVCTLNSNYIMLISVQLHCRLIYWFKCSKILFVYNYRYLILTFIKYYTFVYIKIVSIVFISLKNSQKYLYIYILVHSLYYNSFYSIFTFIYFSTFLCTTILILIYSGTLNCTLILIYTSTLHCTLIIIYVKLKFNFISTVITRINLHNVNCQ